MRVTAVIDGGEQFELEGGCVEATVGGDAFAGVQSVLVRVEGDDGRARLEEVAIPFVRFTWHFARFAMWEGPVPEIVGQGGDLVFAREVC